MEPGIQTQEMIGIDLMGVLTQILVKVHNLLELYLQNFENPEKSSLWSKDFAETEWSNVQKIIMSLTEKQYCIPPKPLGEHIQQVLVGVLKTILKKLLGWSNRLIDYLHKITFSDLFDIIKQVILFLFTDEKFPNNFLVPTTRKLQFQTNTKIQLTQREQQCLDLYLRGLSAKEAAKTLDLSYRTVECHLARIKKKFNRKNLRELLYYYSPTVERG